MTTVPKYHKLNLKKLFQWYFCVIFDDDHDFDQMAYLTKFADSRVHKVCIVKKTVSYVKDFQQLISSYFWQESGVILKVKRLYNTRPQCLQRVSECTRKLWETLRRSGQNLAIWASQRMLFDPTKTFCFFYTYRGTRREYSSKPLKHSIFKRIFVFKL